MGVKRTGLTRKSWVLVLFRVDIQCETSVSLAGHAKWPFLLVAVRVRFMLRGAAMSASG